MEMLLTFMQPETCPTEKCGTSKRKPFDYPFQIARPYLSPLPLLIIFVILLLDVFV
jgi:hypothetical protein